MLAAEEKAGAARVGALRAVWKVGREVATGGAEATVGATVAV